MRKAVLTLLILTGIGFSGLVAWYEITTPLNERLAWEAR